MSLGLSVSCLFSVVSASDIIVTQVVVDNSNAPGGSGSGGGGGAASAGTGASVSAHAPTPTPTLAPKPTPAPVPIVTPELTLTPIPVPIPISEPIPTPTPSPSPAPVPTPAPSPVSDVSTSGGGFFGGFTQAVQSIGQSVTDTILVGAKNFQAVAKDVARVSTIVADNTGQAVRSPVGKVVTTVVGPIGVVSGGLAVGSQILISTTTVTSFSDIYLLIIRTFGLVLGLVRKKRRPWGTVYDSVTKRPLDPAYVTISKSGEEVTDALTDLDGRFGFFLPSGTYTLNASKTNYEFPSKKLAGKDRDEMYENIYYGDAVENKEGEVVIRNIPLDPVTFDWNEFQKDKQKLFRLYSETEKKWKRTFDYIYRLGFFGALLAAIFNGNLFNYIFVGFYAAIITYQTFFIKKRTAVALKYAVTNEPIPFSIVKLFSAEAGNQVKSVVADQLGRFYLLVGPGKYYLTVDAKMPDASYKTIYKSEVMDLKDGIVSNDIVIPGN